MVRRIFTFEVNALSGGSARRLPLRRGRRQLSCATARDLPPSRRPGALGGRADASLPSQLRESARHPRQLVSGPVRPPALVDGLGLHTVQIAPPPPPRPRGGDSGRR